MFEPMYITLLILFCVIVLLIVGRPRSDIVSLMGLLALTLTGIISSKEALAGFSHPITILMIALFVVGGAIFRTGLAKIVGTKVISLAGTNETKLFLLIMLVTACVGAFISNTGTVVMMMPIVISICTSLGLNPKRYLMPLAFCSALGMFTLISTTPNLVIQDIIIANGFEPLTFFAFAPIGFMALTVGVAGLFFLSKLLVKDSDEVAKKDSNQSLAQLAEKYHLETHSYKLSVGESPLNGHTLAELQISTRYDVNINKISRKSQARFSKSRAEVLAGPGNIITDGDILYCQGAADDIHRFAEENRLTIMKEHASEAFSHDESGIAEVYILPASTFVNRTLMELEFRTKYKVNVLGIQRGGVRLEEDLKDIKLKAGDGLLVYGKWSDLATMGSERNNFILAGQPLEEAAKVTLDKKAPLAAFIMLIMILCMVFNVLPPAIAVLTAAVVMIVTGCLRNVEEAYGAINWQAIVLIAAMMPMVTAFENTGLTAAIANLLTLKYGALGPYALLIGVYLSTSMLTMVVSNTATAILFAPIAMKAAMMIGVSPYPFMFAVAVAATMSFASPFSTPPNAIVMTAGRYSFMDYVKVGLPLQIAMAIVMFIMLPILYPFYR